MEKPTENGMEFERTVKDTFGMNVIAHTHGVTIAYKDFSVFMAALSIANKHEESRIALRELFKQAGGSYK